MQGIYDWQCLKFNRFGDDFEVVNIVMGQIQHPGKHLAHMRYRPIILGT